MAKQKEVEQTIVVDFTRYDFRIGGELIEYSQWGNKIGLLYKEHSKEFLVNDNQDDQDNAIRAAIREIKRKVKESGGTI